LLKDNPPIEWQNGKVRILDQTQLPGTIAYLETADYREVAAAIKEMKIRGAPAIGVAGAYGIALGAWGITATAPDDFRAKLNKVIETIAATRPTAKNLFMAVDRMKQAVAIAGDDVAEIKQALLHEAIRIHGKEIEATRTLAEIGATLITPGSTILTHCNAGPLATTGHGTALGVIIRAHEQGKVVNVFVDETRPLLQGARLTAWELRQAGVPFTLITDSMAGHFMNLGRVDAVITGADRITANGDTANKIGTYSLAVLAHAHDIPFYIAAPTTTLDLSLAIGDEIPIEERAPGEVTHLQGIATAPEGITAANPAFDVTPHHLITAIITERGIVRAPYGEGLRALSD